jgi:hypothetical protein
MSKWWYPYTLTPEQEAEGVGIDRLPDSYAEGAIEELSNEFLQKLFERRRTLLDHTREYCMFSAPVLIFHMGLKLNNTGSCEYSSSETWVSEKGPRRSASRAWSSACG